MVYSSVYELWALVQIVLMSPVINAHAAVSRGTQCSGGGSTTAL